MPSRRSHEKSHHGCVTCKRRRVKCDEIRPKCANCTRRGTECSYLSGYVLNSPESTPGSASTPEAGSTMYLGQVIDSRTPQPPAFPKHSASVSRQISSSQMHDLMLMNKWTWSTWKSLSDQEAKAQEMWQIVAPREAVSNPFLMHGILALSALHLASETAHSPETSREHRAVALRHHDQAIALFRPVLSNITPQNSSTVFGFSALLIILSFALLEFPLEQSTKVSPVEELLTIMTLLKGVKSIATNGLQWIKDGPLGALLSSDLLEVRGQIPDDFKAALARLKAHNSSLYIHDTDIREAFSSTLDYLEQSISRIFAKPLDRPVVLGWMVIVPDRYDALLRDGHPMAQVILAHFATILLNFDFWWAGDWGSSLIRDISQRLTDEWKPMVRFPLEQIATMNAESLKARLDATDEQQ